MAEFAGRVAVVTGSASGMGKATALRLASCGARLALFDVASRGVQETASTIRANGGHALPLELDVANGEEVRQAMDTTARTLGSPFIVAAAAAVYSHNTPLLDIMDADAERAVGVNLLGPLFTVREAARYMIPAGKGGRIILWSSTGARLPFPGVAVYCATKGGIEALTRALAADLAEFGITVNAIAPGAVDTPMIAGMTPLERQIEEQITPLRRIGRPQDIASLVLWLASDDAEWVTGTVIPVDGGQSAVNQGALASQLLVKAVERQAREGSKA